MRSLDELLSAYRDGELTSAEKAQVEAALRRDPSAQLKLKDLDTLAAMFSAYAGEHEVDLADKIMARLPERRVSIGERLSVWFNEMITFRPMQLAGAAMAVLVAVVAVGLVAGRTGEPVAVTEPTIARIEPALPDRVPETAAVSVRSLTPAAGIDAMVVASNTGSTVIFLRSNE